MKNLIVSFVITIGICLCTYLVVDAFAMFNGVDLIEAINQSEESRLATGILSFIYFVLLLCWVYIEIEF